MRRFPLILLFLPAAVPAQSTTPLTAHAAVALGRARSPLVQLAVGRRQAGAGRGRADAAWPNPIAEWRRENYDSPLPPDIFATLQVPVDLTGRRVALRQASGLAMQRAVADSGSTMRQLEFDVLRAFWRASLADELSVIADAERSAREQTATFDNQRFREGAVAEVVAMRARLEADRANIAAASATAEAARARADLARALGVPMATLGALAPLAAPGIDGPLPDTAWASVGARRTDVVGARAAAAETERRWQAERRGVFGDINVVGGYKGTGGYATGLLGVMVPLPLFNRNDGPRERTRGEHTMAQAELTDAENRAKGEVTAAVHAWAAVRAAERAGAATLDARASEIARIAEASYREGAISLMELIETQRARADARAASARWMVEANLARLELQRATGAPLLLEP